MSSNFFYLGLIKCQEEMRSIQNLHDKIVNNNDVPWPIRIPVTLISAILFQGTLYMDKTERNSKLTITLILSIIIKSAIPFSNHAYLKSISAAHFLNFVFNSHLWALCIHTFENISLNTTRNDFKSWIDRLEKFGNESRCIAAVAVYGSGARGEITNNSDLDVRVVRYPGMVNGILSSLHVFRHRMFASVTVFPIDIYLLDDVSSLDQLRNDENPMVLVDKEDWI